MLNRINSSNELNKYYDVEFYEQEKYFNTIPSSEANPDEDAEVVDTVHIIYDGGGVEGWEEEVVK